MPELTGIALVWAAAAEPGEWACPACDAVGKARRGDFCKACHDRWRKAGRPEDGPPLSFYARAELLRQEYLRLRAFRVDREEARERVGISKHTAEKLEAELARAKAGGKP